jgi:hypothetical protein
MSGLVMVFYFGQATPLPVWRNQNHFLFEFKQIPKLLFVINRDVQVDSSGQEASMSGRSPHLCQRAATSLCMTDEGMSAVMDG